jgi:hypothetical protein
MNFIRRNAKRIGVDAAGYLLIVLAVLTGWLPGPGGIPLALAGLALLSINNEWARRLRIYLLDNGGKLVQFLFPVNPLVQWAYDALVIVLLIVVTALAFAHNALWQVSLAILLFFVAVFLAVMNRDRISRLKRKK